MEEKKTTNELEKNMEEITIEEENEQVAEQAHITETIKDETIQDEPIEDEALAEEPDPGQEEDNKKGFKRWLPGIAALLILAIIAGVLFIQLNRFEKREDVVLVELGEKVSKKATDYVKVGAIAKQKVVLNTKAVNAEEIGSYKATASYRGKTIEIAVKVQDTTAPEIELEEHLFVGLEKEISSDDMIKTLKDKGGISKIEFKEAQIEKDDVEENDEGYAPAYLKYHKTGDKKNTIIVTDNSGNQAEQDFTIRVLDDDYMSHIKGFKDWTLEKGATVDFMNGITYDAIIKEIKADSSKVKLDTIGEYKLTYTITVNDDAKTKLEKTVSVNVVSKKKAEASADKSNTSKKDKGNASGGNSGDSSNQGNGNASGGNGGSTSGGNSGSTSGGNSGSTSGGNNSSASGGNSSNGSAPEKKPVWVEPVRKDVWVVDSAAYTTYEPVYDMVEYSICNVCGANVTGDPAAHAEVHMLAGEGGGHHAEWVLEQVGTTEVHHPEVGHWESQVIQEGYWK